MKDKMPFVLPIAVGFVLLAVIVFLLPDSIFSGFGGPRRPGHGTGDGERVAGRLKNADEDAEDSGPPARDLSAELLAALLMRLSSKEAKPNEALLTFASDEAMKEFLARADQSGLKVLGKLDALNMVRVGFDDPRALRNELRDHADDYSGWGANYYVHIPEVPPTEDRPQQQEVGFGDGALAFMGIKGDTSAWGKGVTIAILDSGVAQHPAFAQGQVKYIDIGMGLNGTTDIDGHATAVASLAAGTSAGVRGVAPAADILSIRVTNPDGVSDMFTLAQGIQAAVDAGAKVINISLGAYNESSVLSRMIEYAESRGSVIVASAGNDQAPHLTWPAADPRVISVGSVDALGQQVTFSNSGETLSMTAPGLELNTAWPGNQIVSFDGTSGSAPLVAGAIAAVMSLNPQLTARQAATLLTTYSADAGRPGQDPDFGYGTTDVGYALNFDNSQYVDTSISSQYFDADAGIVGFVIQNRSGQGVGDMTLTVNAAGDRRDVSVPYLAPGARWEYVVPVNQGMLASEGQLAYISQLRNPNGIIDQNPGNNRRATVVYKAGD